MVLIGYKVCIIPYNSHCGHFVVHGKDFRFEFIGEQPPQIIALIDTGVKKAVRVQRPVHKILLTHLCIREVRLYVKLYVHVDNRFNAVSASQLKYIHIVRRGKGMRAVNKPDKLMLDNPNLFTVLCTMPDVGSIRESFFVSQVSLAHQLHYHDKGDFIVDEERVFEVGGASKSDAQLQGNKKGYVAADDIEIGYDNKIPLWLFGFMY